MAPESGCRRRGLSESIMGSVCPPLNVARQWKAEMGLCKWLRFRDPFFFYCYLSCRIKELSPESRCAFLDEHIDVRAVIVVILFFSFLVDIVQSRARYEVILSRVVLSREILSWTHFSSS